jgi:hypothetical protein
MYINAFKVDETQVENLYKIENLNQNFAALIEDSD